MFSILLHVFSIALKGGSELETVFVVLLHLVLQYDGYKKHKHHSITALSKYSNQMVAASCIAQQLLGNRF